MILIAKILICDDSAIMRLNMKQILLEEGHIIIAEAEDGRDAVQRYKEYKPDLVTMDVTMPIMDGIEASREILEHDPNASIVMVSAINQRRTVLELLKYGVKNYIIKPINKSKVIKAVNSSLPENRQNDGFKILREEDSILINVDKRLDRILFLYIKKSIDSFLVFKPTVISFNLEKKEFLTSEIEDDLLKLIESMKLKNINVKLNFNSKKEKFIEDEYIY